jgi:hypothetical protein
MDKLNAVLQVFSAKSWPPSMTKLPNQIGQPMASKDVHATKSQAAQEHWYQL